MTIEAQAERLERAVGRLLDAAAVLADEVFLAPMVTRAGRSAWSPRDVVAHLIGWNRCVVEGGRQIARGELPFYDVDPGEDYSKVNAALVRRHSSRDRELLSRELRTTAGELRTFLLALDPGAWAGDHGVRNAGSIVTIEKTVEELIADYDHHRTQIEELPRKLSEPVLAGRRPGGSRSR